MPKELVRLQKLPLFFLFKLGLPLESVLSPAADVGRSPAASGDVFSWLLLRALKDSIFLRLPGRFALVDLGQGESLATYAAAANWAFCIPVFGDVPIGGGEVGKVPGMLGAGLEKYASFDSGLFCRRTGLR